MGGIGWPQARAIAHRAGLRAAAADGLNRDDLNRDDLNRGGPDRAAPSSRAPVRLVPGDAVEHVLAEDAVAMCDLPGFDTAAMDGWAVCGDGPWLVVGEVLAGAAPDRALGPGEATGIATGAAVPPGADEVIRSEDGVVADGRLTADRVSIGHHVRPRGEELRRGDVLVAAGSIISPARAGLIAAAGVDRVAVVPRPRVHVLLLGDELLTSGLPGVGQVRDSLGPQLPGWIARLGGEVTAVNRVADTVADLVNALRSVGQADVIVTTGGTAAGPVDCLHAALGDVGATLLVDSVSVRPGHPMVLADWDGVPVLGLPGNPQSAVVALMSLGAPLIRGLLGAVEPGLGACSLSTGLTAPRMEHRLVLGTCADGAFTAVSHLGSAMLRGLAAAEGFAVIPPGGAAAGAVVAWLPLP